MSAAAGAGITRRPFGRLADGQPVDEVTLDNGRGLVLSAVNLGGAVTSLQCPDRHRRPGNVVLALAAPCDERHVGRNFGTLVGRYANRIAGACFTLDGQPHVLPANDGTNTLHGGPAGFGARWWSIDELPPQADGSIAVELGLCSDDGDQGFPGRLEVKVRYTLTPAQEWRIDYQARSDRATVVNLTHHAYWNLAGGGSALGHRLMLAASRYAAVDARLVPLRYDSVDGTPFDFRRLREVAERLRDDHEQIVLAHGYDHHWVIDRPAPGLVPAARLEDPLSGRVLEIETTEPGLQFYSGNFLDGSLVSRAGRTLRQGDGLCLETQHAPDAPHRADELPGVTLRPGQTWRSTTVHRFGVVA